MAGKPDPRRLVETLLETGVDPLDEKTVKAILEQPLECAPLLIDLVREWLDHTLDPEDVPAVDRAVRLLGEMGIVGALPEMLPLLVEDETSDAADWAMKRLASQRPTETSAEIRSLAPRLDLNLRLTLAAEAGVLPELPDRMEIMLEILRSIPGPLDPNAAPVVMAVMASALGVEGSPDGSGMRAVIAEAQRLVPPETLPDEEAMQEGIFGPPGMDEDEEDLDEDEEEADVGEPTIYDFCCSEFVPADEEFLEDPFEGDPEDFLEDDDEDDDVPLPVVVPPKPGRNEPCWCGSGKKYKKCHLAQDESRSR